MIPRYTRPAMAKIWSDDYRVKLWLDIELAVLEAFVKLGIMTPTELDEIRSKASASLDEIQAREARTQHDIIAFVETVAAPLGKLGRYIHMGLTSSDILDTATAIQLKESCDHLLSEIERLLETLKAQALQYKYTPCVGRTHGVHAEPMTFGLKFLLWFEEFTRHRERLMATRERVAVGKISGAVGVYAHVEPAVEFYVCQKFGLKPEPISNQIVQRDRHAEYAQTLALIGASVEKVALEIRHLQRTEVREAAEPFGKGQKGSSAMPHKRNPIVAERLCGMARLLRAYAVTALENVALWHERDISHSSTERIWMPDASILLDYMLDRLTWMIGNLAADPEAMKRNLNLTRGLVASSGVLVALLKKGLDRITAYEAVQRCAMRVWDEGVAFVDALMDDDIVRQHLSPDEINRLLDPGYYQKHIEFIYRRVLEPRASLSNHTPDLS